MNILEFNRFNRSKQFNGIFSVNNSGFQVNCCKDPPSCRFTALQLIDKNSEDEHRHGHSCTDQQEGYELSSCNFTFLCKPTTSRDKKSKCNTCNNVNHRNKPIPILTCTHCLVSIRTRFSVNTVGFPFLSVVCLNHGNSRNQILENGCDITCGFTLLSILTLNTG